MTLTRPSQETPNTMNEGGIRVWLLAARPKTLWAGVAPVFIGTAIAWADDGFHALAALAALAGSLLIQIGTNYANDYFDFVKGTDTEERIGPMRATQAGLVSPGQMKLATILVFALAFLVGLYLVYRGGWPILVIGLASILCGVLYTGGPYPLGYLGLGDLFVLVFFGPVAVAGTYYVQVLEFDTLPVIAGLAPGLFSVALLTVNNLRDVEGDRISGKKTLAVRLGPTFAKFEYVTALLLGGLAVPIYCCVVHDAHWWALASCLVLLMAIRPAWMVFTVTGPKLNEVLAATGKMLLFFGVLFSIGWIL